MRVVSVLPSATEIVAALGRLPDLVGRSEECDFPPEVRSLPVVMRARTRDSERPSAEIDRRVQAARGTDASLYEIDVAALRELDPDVLLTQDLCGVCSVTDREMAAACRSAGVSPTIVSVAPRALGEVWESIETIGHAIGAESAAGSLAADLRRRTVAPRTPSEARPRVAVVEWLDPPILAGLWTPDLVEAAGGAPVGPSRGEVGERTSWARIRNADLDLLVISPCSFSVERTRRELEDPSLVRQVRAACGAQGIVLADEAYFSRPGPRLADGVELLRHAVHGSLGSLPMPAEYLLRGAATEAT